MMITKSEATKNCYTADDGKSNVPDQKHFFLLAYFCESMRHTAVSTEEKGCQNLIAFRRIAKS